MPTVTVTLPTSFGSGDDLYLGTEIGRVTRVWHRGSDDDEWTLIAETVPPCCKEN